MEDDPKRSNMDPDYDLCNFEPFYENNEALEVFGNDTKNPNVDSQSHYFDQNDFEPYYDGCETSYTINMDDTIKDSENECCIDNRANLSFNSYDGNEAFELNKFTDTDLLQKDLKIFQKNELLQFKYNELQNEHISKSNLLQNEKDKTAQKGFESTLNLDASCKQYYKTTTAAIEITDNMSMSSNEDSNEQVEAPEEVRGDSKNIQNVSSFKHNEDYELESNSSSDIDSQLIRSEPLIKRRKLTFVNDILMAESCSDEDTGALFKKLNSEASINKKVQRKTLQGKKKDDYLPDKIQPPKRVKLSGLVKNKIYNSKKNQPLKASSTSEESSVESEYELPSESSSEEDMLSDEDTKHVNYKRKNVSKNVPKNYSKYLPKHNSKNLPKDITNNTYSRKHRSYEFDKKIPEENVILPENCFVPESSEGGKWYGKDGCCCYCGNIYKRLDRHLTSIHYNQNTVEEINNLPKKSAKRLELFAILRNHGNERYNKDSSINPTGRIIAKRRLAKNRGRPLTHLRGNDLNHQNVENTENPENDEIQLSNLDEDNCNSEENLIEKTILTAATMKNKVDVDEDYQKSQNEAKKKKILPSDRVICSECRAYFSKNCLSKHFAAMHAKKTEMTTKNILAASKRESHKFHVLASERMRQDILPYLNEDETGTICRYDYLIILYGNKYAERHSILDQAKLVRGHMRLLAKLFIEVKKIDPRVIDLAYCFRGTQWEKVLDACKELSGYDAETDSLENAYNGRTLGMLIKRCIIILRSRFSVEEKDKELKWLETFESEFDDEYSVTIATKATKTENSRRRTNVEELPTSKDIKTFDRYLQAKIKTCYDYLTKNGFEFTYWISLIEALMISLQLFNIRRSMEVDRITVKQFINRKTSNVEDEYFQSMAADDQRKALKYDRMDGQGKKIDGIDSTTYISKFDIACIELILKHRKKAGVPENNIFLFGLPNPNDTRMKHAVACQAIVKLVKECDEKFEKLEKPLLLRGTNIRKRFATKFGTLKQDNKLDAITNHMAHTVTTHKKHYRKTVDKTDVEVTKVLELMNGRNDSMQDEYEKEESEEELNKNASTSAPLNDSDDSPAKLQLPNKKKSFSPRVKWTDQDNFEFQTCFKKHLKNRQYPSASEMREAMKKYPCLQKRGEKSIRTKFSNIYNK